VVREGVDGFLVREGDIGALAERVSSLLVDPDLRAAMAARAGEGLDQFDRDAMVRQQELLYAELLTSRRP
jgi:glycosyltransferase involved in cell wall biosynthesis